MFVDHPFGFACVALAKGGDDSAVLADDLLETSRDIDADIAVTAARVIKQFQCGNQARRICRRPDAAVKIPVQFQESLTVDFLSVLAIQFTGSTRIIPPLKFE